MFDLIVFPSLSLCVYSAPERVMEGSNQGSLSAGDETAKLYQTAGVTIGNQRIPPLAILKGAGHVGIQEHTHR